MVIKHWVVLNNTAIMRDGTPVSIQATTTGDLTTFKNSNLAHAVNSPEDVYRTLGCSYPKFFKMDKLCKWAFVASELLLEQGKVYEGLDTDKISLALATGHGCLDVDKRYFETVDMPSPALFVYTLPNIMLGEICIRNGFKGAQVCMVSEQFDPAEIYFAASNFLRNKHMAACLCGWIEVSDTKEDIALFWVSNEGKGYSFTPQNMLELSRLSGVH